MTKRSKTYVVSAVALTAAFLSSATPALAQTEATTAAEVDAAAAEETGIEDIVVTARLRNESLQKVPVSVTAFSEKMLQDAQVNEVADFIGMTPNLSINKTQSSGVSFLTIRGISQVRNGESPVATVVDGVQQVTSRQFTQDLFDIERIEVLRGPQGALYGRNAIGGAIVITTKQPTNEFEGNARVSAGRGDDYRLQGSMSGPIIDDKLLFNLAGSYRNFGGLLKNVYLNKMADGSEELTVRGRLRAFLTDRLTADLRANISTVESGAGNFQFQGANYDPARPCFLDPTNPFGGPAPDADFVQRDLCATNLGHGTRDITEVSFKLGYDADAFTITNILSWNKIVEYLGSDQFPYTASVDVFGTDGTQTQYENLKAWSNEIRIASPATQSFRWMFGAYYLDTSRYISTTTGDDNLQGILKVKRQPFFNDPRNPTLTFLADDNDNKAWALFGNLAYDITDGLEASVALRYDEDKRTQFIVPLSTGPLPTGCTTTATVNCDRTETFSKLQPKVTLKYQVNDDVSIFGSWGIGFRSGQFNQAGVAAAAGLPGVFDVVRQEEASTFDLGFKSQWLNRRLRINGSIFTTEDKNPFYFVFVGSIGAQVLVNIDKVRLYGGEIEVVGNLAQGLDVYANIGYTHSEITEFDFSPATIGNWAPYIPRVTWAAGVQYRTPITEGLRLFTRADIEHHGKQYWDPDNSTARSGYELVNARLGLEDAGDAWSLTASVSNLFDKAYNSEWVFGGFGHPAQPRTWSVELKYNF